MISYMYMTKTFRSTRSRIPHENSTLGILGRTPLGSLGRAAAIAAASTSNSAVVLPRRFAPQHCAPLDAALLDAVLLEAALLNTALEDRRRCASRRSCAPYPLQDRCTTRCAGRLWWSHRCQPLSRRTISHHSQQAVGHHHVVKKCCANLFLISRPTATRSLLQLLAMPSENLAALPLPVLQHKTRIATQAENAVISPRGAWSME